MHWETKMFLWVALLRFLLYHDGLELNPKYLQGLPVCAGVLTIERDSEKKKKKRKGLCSLNKHFLRVFIESSEWSYTFKQSQWGKTRNEGHWYKLKVRETLPDDAEESFVGRDLHDIAQE